MTDLATNEDMLLKLEMKCFDLISEEKPSGQDDTRMVCWLPEDPDTGTQDSARMTWKENKNNKKHVALNTICYFCSNTACFTTAPPPGPDWVFVLLIFRP